MPGAAKEVFPLDPASAPLESLLDDLYAPI